MSVLFVVLGSLLFLAIFTGVFTVIALDMGIEAMLACLGVTVAVTAVAVGAAFLISYGLAGVLN